MAVSARYYLNSQVYVSFPDMYPGKNKREPRSGSTSIETKINLMN